MQLSNNYIKLLIYTEFWNKYKLDGDFMTFVFDVPKTLWEARKEAYDELELYLKNTITNLVPPTTEPDEIQINNIYPY